MHAVPGVSQIVVNIPLTHAAIAHLAFEDAFVAAISNPRRSLSQLASSHSSSQSPSSPSPLFGGLSSTIEEINEQHDTELFEAKFTMARSFVREKKEYESKHHADIQELEQRYSAALRAEERDNDALQRANTSLQRENVLLKEELALIGRVRTRMMADQNLPPPYEA